MTASAANHLMKYNSDDVPWLIPEVKVKQKMGAVLNVPCQINIPGERAIIRLDWNKKQKNWLLKAYEKYDPYPNAGRTTEGPGSESSGPAPAPHGEGANKFTTEDRRTA